MFAHEREPTQLCDRISLATIDTVVAAQLGQTRVRATRFNRQIAMNLPSTSEGGARHGSEDSITDGHHARVCHTIKRIEVLRKSHAEVPELLSTLTREIKSAIPAQSEAGQTL